MNTRSALPLCSILVCLIVGFVLLNCPVVTADPIIPPHTFDFEDDTAGFTLDDQWHRTDSCASSYIGHTGTYSLRAGGLDEYCTSDQSTFTGTATSPEIDASGCQGLALYFNYWFDPDGLVEVSVDVEVSTDGVNFFLLESLAETPINDFSGRQNWAVGYVDLSLFDGSPSLTFRFKSDYDESIPFPSPGVGFHVDDINLFAERTLLSVVDANDQLNPAFNVTEQGCSATSWHIEQTCSEPPSDGFALFFGNASSCDSTGVGFDCITSMQGPVADSPLFPLIRFDGQCRNNDPGQFGTLEFTGENGFLDRVFLNSAEGDFPPDGVWTPFERVASNPAFENTQPGTLLLAWVNSDNDSGFFSFFDVNVTGIPCGVSGPVENVRIFDGTEDVVVPSEEVPVVPYRNVRVSFDPPAELPYPSECGVMFSIEIQAADDPDSRVKMFEGTTDHFFVFDFLEPETTYYCVIWAENSSFQTPSVMVAFTTDSADPIAPHMIYPADGQAGVEVVPRLEWDGGQARCCDVLYGAGANKFYRIDPYTGHATFIGVTGYYGMTGMTFHPNGKLYATCFDPDIEDALLVTINTETGAATPVGRLDPNDPLMIYRVTDISLGPDGQVYGYALHQSSTGLPDELITIDVETGLGTRLGPTGFDGGGNGMDFSPDGRLYATPSRNNTPLENCLVEVDPNTGAGSCVPGSEGQLPFRINALEFCDRSGTLYGSYNHPDYTILIRIDPATGMYTEVGPFGDPSVYIDALAFGCESLCPTNFDVYVGTENPPDVLVCQSESVSPCVLSGMVLESCTEYYVQVVATNCYDASSSPVLSFVTGAAGDINDDSIANMVDYGVFASQWKLENCDGLDNCQGADINKDGLVNLADLEIIAMGFLSTCD